MSQLIVCPYSGFSNRLKSLISASLLDADYKVYWPADQFCGLKYSDIFHDTFREIAYVPDNSVLLNTWRFELPEELQRSLPAGFSDCSTGYKGITFPGDNESRTIDFEYQKIPHEILKLLSVQFNGIRFSEEIMTRVNRQLRAMPDHFVGVHARTWYDEQERTQKWFDFEDFVSICSLFQDKELFVTSDDPRFIENMSRALGKQLITMNRAKPRVQKPWQHNSREEMLDDIAELLVLSKASQLVLTAMSTYSEVAWYFGGCTEEIFFADPDFRHKEHADHVPTLPPHEAVELKEHNVHWVEVAGSYPYLLALIPGFHVHLDHLGDGPQQIGDYVEKYSGYMKGSAPDDYMIDIGANLGLSAFPVASIPRRVIAFEPVTENIEAMKKTIARNGFDNVKLIPSAVSARTGETHMYVPQGRADNSSFGEDVANANVLSPKVFQYLVHTETIDNWFEEQSNEFSPEDAKLLKIDVQGYETAVLLGAKGFLAACRRFQKLVIEFEFDPKLTRMAGYSIVALLELVHSYGLEIYYNNSLIPSDYYDTFCRQEITCDLIAVFRQKGDSEQRLENQILNNSPHPEITMNDGIYGQDFYNSQMLGSLQSAQVYLYHLFSIWGVPESVADLGCGRGTWLATCRDLGVKRVVGFDGHWNSQEDMLDPNIEFYPTNLDQIISLKDSFDLAISLEVAEHLQPESSDTFVESLSRLSDAVMFGAAFVGQPGANHINTRLHSFWAEKFFDRGYLLFDLFRPTFWDDDRVEPCYRQNTFLYVKPEHPLYSALRQKGYPYNQGGRFIDCVHPVIYRGLLNEFVRLQQLVGAGLQNLPIQEASVSDYHPNSTIDQLIEQAEAQTALYKLADAADTYRLALGEEPNNPECLLRLSHLLVQLNHHEESFHHARHFLRVVDDVALGYFLAGRAAREIGRWQESRSYLLRAGELDPSNLYARVLSCMSVFTVCMDQTETESVIRTYAAELDQLVQYTHLETAEQINNAADGIGALPPFFLPYLGFNIKDLQTKYGYWVCAIMAAKYPQFSHLQTHQASNKKIKIGIVSHYFHTHSNWKIPISGWLKQLDRQMFSLHCFYTGDISDQVTASARSLADSFLQSGDIESLASNIYEQNFDVLIYPGIGMDSVTLKLAALRLAPVQCASWGHPVTTGMPTIDYYISSELMEPPDGDGHYSEKLIRLPNLSIWYEPAKQEVDVYVNPKIAGLEKHDVVYLCCQNLLKYLPQYDFIFPAIAESVINARFIFIASTVPELTEKFMQRLERAFQSRELNAATYVSVIPQLGEAGFSALNERADIFLDSIEWSGCNTVFESLPYNKPIVTLPGTFMRGRHAYAILKMMRIEDTIATSTDDYISIAVRLAHDLQWREDISAKISYNKHRIYRDRGSVDGLERFLKGVSGYRRTDELSE